MSSTLRTPRSPNFSDTLNGHMFMTNVIQRVSITSPQPTAQTSSGSTHEFHPSDHTFPSTNGEPQRVRKSLEELSKDIRELDDFLTVSEDVLRRERERDREFYEREHRRKLQDMSTSGQNINNNNNKENRSPVTRPIYSVQSPTYKRSHHVVLRKCKSANSSAASTSRATLRKGRLSSAGCNESKSGQDTQELIKSIIRMRNDSVSPADPDVLPEEFGHSYLDASVAPNKIGEELDSNKDSLEMIVIDCAPDQPPVMYGSVVGEGNGMELTQKPGQASATSTRSNATINSEVRTQVHHLVRRFTARASKMRTRLDLPPTPTSAPSTPVSSRSTQIRREDVEPEQRDTEKTSGGISVVHTMFEADHPSKKNLRWPTSFCGKSGSGQVLDPQGKFYISWLCVVSMTFLYNAWVIPLRSSFPFQTPENTNMWISVDICGDIVYFIDVIFIKHRLMYLYEGFWVRDKNLTRTNYMRKLQFKLDILSLIPLDLLYFVLGTQAVFLRAPRLLKIQSFWEFFKLLDRVISSPHMVRVAKTLTYMLYMIHLTACTYYAYSDYQGLGSDRWVFSGKGHPYVRSFAFATKTATSIGKNPKPDTIGELMFMTAAWLMGVFVFALLIGQIRDIIATATRSQSEYRQLVDETLEYMRRLSLPTEMQRRVKMWFQFTWEQQRTLDEGLILDYLPANLKTDIAISVHIQTLSKVQLFADCEEALLRELVLKLRSVTFLPGDFVCRKGEVGREMYIVKVGQLQVMGGIKNDQVLATLSESSVFGEISLLAINGAEGNRRTADVKSKGFSNLFVLSKSDLNEAIVYYPNAQAVLRRRARSLMQKNAERERKEAIGHEDVTAGEPDVVIGNPIYRNPTIQPKLLRTVMQALPEESAAARLLTHGSKREKTSGSHVQSLNSSSSKSVLLSIEHEKEQPLSLGLLEAIQSELEKSSSKEYINLTDSEKALIVSGTNRKESLNNADNLNEN